VHIIFDAGSVFFITPRTANGANGTTTATQLQNFQAAGQAQIQAEKSAEGPVEVSADVYEQHEEDWTNNSKRLMCRHAGVCGQTSASLYEQRSHMHVIR